ncbi:MAG: hypothetical protein CMM26_00670 [Rhodospirillaceae bacterium]|nr:hypothetical protein [Rhodospirillaceae bacterium]|tara:strand:- start:45 stop:473 length:429 start_codon:yes stop_codon:yes gene_type:complete
MLAAYKRPSLSQTYKHALASPAAVRVEKAALSVIRFNRQPIRLVVAYSKPILRAPGSQTIYRGTLSVHDKIPGQIQKLAVKLLRWRFRLRRGRPVTLHPGLENTSGHRTKILTAGPSPASTSSARSMTSIWNSAAIAALRQT